MNQHRNCINLTLKYGEDNYMLDLRGGGKKLRTIPRREGSLIRDKVTLQLGYLAFAAN